MSVARSRCPARTLASAMVLAGMTALGAQEPADTTKPPPSKIPGRKITVDQTPMGSVRTTDVVITPTAFYGPESGFGVGAALVGVQLADRKGLEQRPTTYQATVQATLRQLYTVSTTGDIWTRLDRFRYTYELAWSHAPMLFHGIGEASRPDGELWIATTFRGTASASRQVVPHLYVGVQGMAEAVSVGDVDPGELLAGSVPGSQGWAVVQVGTMSVYDTRDRYYFPRRGVFASAALVRADPIVGSEFRYTRLTVDVRGYHAITGEHVLAGQLWIDGIAGTAPFERLPQLGGPNILRGLYRGRFRDRDAFALQGEYRTPAWHQFGAALFAGVGAVAAQPQQFDAGRVHAAGGVGLRFALINEDGRLNIRLDHGWARGGGGTYFTVGEAF